MREKDAEKSFGELPTLGHEETVRSEMPAGDGPSWTALGLSEVETLKSGEGIRDDGRTDGARRWKAGEEILGRYVVERELGQGGMGVVYGCLDKVGGVRVAVKGLPPELSHDSVEMEEVRENFRLAGDLRHPCIAGVRTLEKDERGEFYLVMDLAEGESLRKWERDKWKAGGISLAEAVGVLRQVASALDYAHRRKVVHRDVKPGNVMIDGKGEVKVLDFGLADQIRTSLSRASHAYRGTSGTGPYMSPEQWRGQPQDGKTDQYALGVMAYEMLAGRLPFGSSDLGVLREVVLKEMPPAIPGLPESAMAAIRRAMAKREEERFGSCGEFVEALVGKRKDRPTALQGQDLDAATAGRQGGEADVFLRKVRVGKALEAAGREDAKAGEQAELGRVREMFAAGEEALKAGDRAAAGALLGQAEEGLSAWQSNLAARREVEARSEAERRTEKRRLAEAWQELRRRREEEREARKQAEIVQDQRKLAERMARARTEEAVRKEDERKRAETAAGRRRRRILTSKVVGALVLVCLMGWCFWNMSSPSAEDLLHRALRQAERGHFQKALHLTIASRGARHHTSYDLQIQERMLAIHNWQETAIAWETIQENLQNARWIGAQQGFNKVSKWNWNWNKDSAIKHKQRAVCVERLLNAFLEMRAALNSADTTATDLEVVRDSWEKALADAEREPAMQDAVWAISFEAETATGENAQTIAMNKEYTNVWHPLRDAGSAISSEIQTGIAAAKNIRTALSWLSEGDILSAPAAACRAAIHSLHEADQRHKQSQIEDQQENGYQVLRFCHLAENEYNRVWLPLDDLVAAEKIVISNLETIAAMGTDWEKRLQSQLAFPYHTDDILLRDYQTRLESANASLCGRMQTELKNIHLAAFLKMGMEDPSGTPTAVARLTRPGMIQDAMRFIDWTQPPSRWGAETPIPGCVYDEVLGSFYTYEFLTSPGETAEDFLTRTPAALEEERQFCPVARQAREDYAMLKAFVDFVNAEPLFKAAAMRLAPLPGKQPNLLKQYYERTLTLLRQRDNWLAETVEPFFKDWNRNGVLARVLWLIVSPCWDAQMHESANSIRRELFKGYIRAAQDESNGLVDYLKNCIPDSYYFNEWREYAASHSLE